jgi:phosphotransacetylase/acyl dehydratase
VDFIENRTFDELALGDRATLARTLTRADIELFAVMSGDVNPAHLDDEYARSDIFHKIIAHGMWGGALISTVLGTVLPGPGTIYLGQTLRFRRPVAVGDTVTVTVSVAAKDPERRRVTLECLCTNQDGEAVITGSAEVIAPAEKVKRPRVTLPQVLLRERGANYRAIIARAAALPPLRAAVVNPAEAALRGALQAAEAGLLAPLMLGPVQAIRAAAEQAGLDIAALEIVDVGDGREAVARAVAMARAGEVQALVDYDARYYGLLHAVVDRAAGLSDRRWISHVHVMDVPSYPRPLFITDAGMSIAPTLEEKRAIVQNAIDLALALGIEQPRVAVLAAVQMINPKLRSTLDAAALCKMLERGQITGGLVDGPLAFDEAVSEQAARAAGLTSPVAGRADILVAPDLEAGTLLVKQLDHLADAQSAAVLVGARAPVALPEPAGNPDSSLVACAMAALLARRRTAD